MEAPDQLCLSRFILTRIAESFRAGIDFNPKSTENDNNCATIIAFSTQKLRIESRKAKAGIPNNLVPVVQELLSNLSDTHSTYIQYFGSTNQLRLADSQASLYKPFTYGLDNYSCSISIPTEAYLQKSSDASYYRIFKGYLEDRRPSADMDPYTVCAIIAQSTLLPNLP